MSRELHPALKLAAEGMAGIAEAKAADRAPTDEEIGTALGSMVAVVTLAVDAMIRQADALERLAESARAIELQNCS